MPHSLAELQYISSQRQRWHRSLEVNLSPLGVNGLSTLVNMKWYLSRLISLAVYLGLLQSYIVAATNHGTAHDETWEPEYVLVATAQNITTNCESRYSVVFNGTSPGPAIYMREGKTTWVRVYNQIEDQNVTVVCWEPPS
jgi:hypothetical protein